MQAATDPKISTPKLSRLICAVSSGSLDDDGHDNRCSRRSRLDRHLAVELRCEHLHQSVAETTVARLLATLPNSVVRHGELVNISGPFEGHLDDSLAVVWKCMLGRIGN